MLLGARGYDSTLIDRALLVGRCRLQERVHAPDRLLEREGPDDFRAPLLDCLGRTDDDLVRDRHCNWPERGIGRYWRRAFYLRYPSAQGSIGRVRRRDCRRRAPSCSDITHKQMGLPGHSDRLL
jgi:hypothetical protein